MVSILSIVLIVVLVQYHLHLHLLKKWLEINEKKWIKKYVDLNLSLNKTDGEFIHTKKTIFEKSNEMLKYVRYTMGWKRLQRQSILLLASSKKHI